MLLTCFQDGFLLARSMAVGSRPSHAAAPLFAFCAFSQVWSE
jgi:hypothetical protein